MTDPAFLVDLSSHGDRIALREPDTGTAMTYSQLSKAVQAAASLFDADEKGLVFVYGANDAGSITAYLGAVTAGHAVALLDASLTDEMRRHLEHLYSPEWIVEPGLDPGLESGVRRTGSSTGPVHPDLAVLLSTSGSTGSPKFVRLSRTNVMANAESIAAALSLVEEERPITSLPMFYSYGLSVINSHLTVGAELVLTNASVITREFWEVFKLNECSSFAGVPHTYAILDRIGFRNFVLPTLTTMTQAGGKLHPHLALEFFEHMDSLGGQFIIMYGQTEATARMTVLAHDQLPERVASVGLPIPGGHISIEVEGLLTDRPDTPGEIVYFGPNVMMGYASDRSGLAHDDELGGVLHTGDIGFLDPDGFLHITGRSKRIAKIYGLRINLDEVEGFLRAHGPAAVVGVQDTLILFCEFDTGDDYAAMALDLARRLRVNPRSLDFRRVSELPLNPNGKIDYHALTEQT